MRTVYDRVLRDRVRSALPNRIGVYNGVAVRDRALTDARDVLVDYETPLVAALRGDVREGDTVVVVGGGKGVSTVVAGQRVGPDGSVVCYEGGCEGVARVRDTVRLNRTDDRTEVVHAVVGPDVSVWGDTAGAAAVHPTDLPDCDVLELDCEGAELDILTALDRTPRVVVAETHANLGVTAAEVRTLLERRGYAVVAHETEDEAKSIDVLTAVLDDHDRGD